MISIITAMPLSLTISKRFKLSNKFGFTFDIVVANSYKTYLNENYYIYQRCSDYISDPILTLDLTSPLSKKKASNLPPTLFSIAS